jgi:uncharacterized protein YlxP (DUF503 family)
VAFGLLAIESHSTGDSSIKHKHAVLRDRGRRLNIAVAHHDHWQSATLGTIMVCAD